MKLSVDHSGRVVQGMNCFRPLKRCGRSSNSTQGMDIGIYSMFELSYVSSDLAAGGFSAQGILQTAYMIMKL
jgi:hypothetical protein